MTTDTLRERIAALIEEHVIAVSMSDSWLEGQEEAADAILAILPSQTTSLEEVGETMDRLERLAEAAKDDSKTDLFAAQSAGFIQLDRWHYYAAANPHAILLLIRQIRTALADTGWRGIESLNPDDETDVLTWSPERGHVISSGANKPYRRGVFHRNGHHEATMWRPLGPPPLTREEG